MFFCINLTLRTAERHTTMMIHSGGSERIYEKNYSSTFSEFQAGTVPKEQHKSYLHFPFQLSDSLECTAPENVNEFRLLWWWTMILSIKSLVKTPRRFSIRVEKGKPRAPSALAALSICIILKFTRSWNYEKWLNKLFAIRARSASHEMKLQQSTPASSISHFVPVAAFPFPLTFLLDLILCNFKTLSRRRTSHAEIFIINFFMHN